MKKQKQIITDFMKLNRSEQLKIIAQLQKVIKDDSDARQVTQKHFKNCLYCNTDHIIIHGSYKNRKRYLCKNCGKTFTDQTDTPLHNIKKQEKFLDFIDLSMGSEAYLSIREISKRIGICIQTVFEWRHKLLLSLKIEPDGFSDITEIDDVWFLYSQMGRKGLKYSRKRGGAKNKQGDNDFQAKVLITSDRKKHIDMSLIRIGRMCKDDIVRTVGDKFNENTTLVSDKHSSISAFAKDLGIKHKTFKAKDHTLDKEYHVQYVNYLASRLKSVINHQLRGVSTKYLQNYVNWIMAKELYKEVQERIETCKTKISENVGGYSKYINIEKTYEEFIREYSRRTYRCPTKSRWKGIHSEN